MISNKTAIKRTKPSLPSKYIFENIIDVAANNHILDYGCGHGFDADYYGMDKYDITTYPTRPTKKYDIIICNYVLNTVKESEQDAIIKDILSLLKDDGVALISVRRDKFKEGMTKRNTYQRYAKLLLPILHENHNFCLYELHHGSAIMQHGIRCNVCKQELYSNYRHDFKSCKCDQCFIDGGFDYSRIGGTDWTPVQRKILCRGIKNNSHYIEQGV